jgi:hypothetical protein
MPSTAQPRRNVELPQSLHRDLRLYALAAAAAGVGVLALVQPSEAEIVYTPEHQIIGRSGTYRIDLNHDGLTDFTIHDRCLITNSWVSNFLKVIPANGNRVLLSGSGGPLAAALVAGEKIGPEHSQYAAPVAATMAKSFGISGSYLSGPWVRASNLYLGLQFRINGETHYGWARLSVTSYRDEHLITATLTGYAYETEANKAILAGQFRENSVRETETEEQSANDMMRPPRSNTLGALAMGTSGIQLWRRE